MERERDNCVIVLNIILKSPTNQKQHPTYLFGSDFKPVVDAAVRFNAGSVEMAESTPV